MNAKGPLITVALYLRGDQLQPHSISKLLGIDPSDSQEKGQLSGKSNDFVAKIGIWSLKSQTDSPVITDHVDEVLQMLRRSSIPLDQIEGVEEAYLDIFVALDDEDDQGKTVEVMLSNTYTTALHRHGLGLQFTVT